MIREFSAGGIVLRPAQDKYLNDKWEVLVTQHSQNKHWSFPKGLIEKGQSSKEAALREVKEEGGVEVEIIDKIGESKYVYTNKDKQKVFKVVVYFLMKYLSGDIKDHDWEVSDIGWFSPDKAQERLSFAQDKKLLQKALEYLKTNPFDR